MSWLDFVCVDVVVFMLEYDDDNFMLVVEEEEVLAGIPGYLDNDLADHMLFWCLRGYNLLIGLWRI